MRRSSLNGWVLLAILAAAQMGCASTRPLRATIVDTAGNPISGALLYYEVYRPGKVIDFGFAESGANGETPRLEAQWRSGAHVALAAFADGKKPTVLNHRLRGVTAEGITIRLRDLPEPGLRWEPRIATLSYPFVHDGALFEQAAAPSAEVLFRAFESAYVYLGEGGEAVLPAEVQKRDALAQLLLFRQSNRTQ